MATPVAEVEITEALVRTLLRAQHPDLAELALVDIGSGWDNSLWRLGDLLLVRLTRRASAVPLAMNEQRWLPVVSTGLPLPVPVPVRIGRPCERFGWPWSVTNWIEGTPGDRADITDPEHTAAVLGTFLRALHRPAPAEAPYNPYRSMALADRAETFEELLRRVETGIDETVLRGTWDRALAADAWSGPPTWIHGDLHPANMLFRLGTLAAVIDFGDMCAGDPATDLASACLLLPQSVWATFIAAYGGAGGHLEARARGWALLFGLMFTEIGANSRPTYGPVGRRGVAGAVAASARGN
ncbi:MAG: aminoglycoside phosphotransferase family protein [Acidimicrobiales bacterium]